jgi:hypothetical protein
MQRFALSSQLRPLSAEVEDEIQQVARMLKTLRKTLENKHLNPRTPEPSITFF